MTKFNLKSLAVAGALAFGALAVNTATANAGDLRISIGGPGYSIGFYDGWGRGRHWGHDRHWGHRRVCRPGKALRKARRRGLRRAHIVRVGHRGVVVRGRKWGERVVMGFGRHRSCPVRFVRAR